MKQEIKEIYNRLSGGKYIDSDAYVITQSQFSSVLLDRFVAELNKKGVKWDRRDIAFGELLAGRPTGATDENRPMPGVVGGGVEGAVVSVERPVDRFAERLPANAPESVSSKSADFAIGIDIQHVAELPDCIDYWEDEFYKMKFTPEEIAYGVTRNNPKETFAGIYSCKEALVKCNNALEWGSIAITHDADGGPQFADYHLSISHSAGTAIAIAVLQKAGYRPAREADARGSERGAADGFKDSPPAEKQGLPKATTFLFLLLSLVILYLLYRDFIR